MSTHATFAARRFVIACLAAALTAAVLAPAVARAGTFDVPACDAAGGANNAWSAFVTNPTVAAYAQCPSGGDPSRGLIARTAYVDAGNSPGVLARLQFDAPPGTSIVGILASYDFSRSDAHWEAALSTGSQVLKGCPAGGLDACTISGVNEWVPVPGSASLYIDVFCAYGSCPQGADPSVGAKARLYSATVRVEDDQPPDIGSPAGSLWNAQWIGGVQHVSFDASDNTGIQENVVLIDGQLAGRGQHASCDYTHPTPCPNGGDGFDVNTRSVSDGPHSLTLQTTDAAGNANQISRTVLIDNTAPGAPQGLSVDGGENWRSDNSFGVGWTNPTGDNGAPVAGTDWQICPDTGSDPCTSGSKLAAGLKSVSGLSVPHAGSWTLRVWLHDAAGNADIRNAAPPVHLRFDGDAPTASFAPADPANPTNITVSASDGTSGLASGTVEIKPTAASAWTPLPTRLTDTGVAAVVPDETLRSGKYDLRATVVDQAGNERSTAELPDGTAARVSLPVRALTHLTAGHRTGAYSAQLRSRVNMRFNGRVKLTGRLIDQQHHPVVHAALTVMQRTALAGAPWKALKAIHTGRTGGFAFRTAAGPSRFIRVRYEGTPTVRPSQQDVTVRVAGASSLSASRRRLRTGHTVRFSGIVHGTDVKGGKLIQLQTRVGGRWQTFATAHTSTHGRWSYSYRFLHTRGDVTYAFRAALPQEHGYPYRNGQSSTVYVRVTG